MSTTGSYGDVALPTGGSLTSILPTGGSSLTSIVDPRHTTTISNSAFSPNRVEKSDDSTVWSKNLAYKISSMDLLLDNDGSERFALDKAKRALLNHVLRECPRCAKCPNVAFKEQRVVNDESLIVYTTCTHQGASSAVTHIICPDDRVSIKSGSVEYVSDSEIKTYTKASKAVVPKSPDLPSTPEVDVW